MKLTASAKLGIQGTSYLLIAVGVILLLGEIRYVGEALESFKINILLNPVSILGAGFVLLPAAILLILFLKRTVTKHH